MIKIDNKEQCMGCHACYNICPKDAISMQHDEKGFLYPVVDNEKCIECGLCEKSCPTKNYFDVKDEKKIIAYAAINKDENIRLNSSSGGIFTLLSEHIIKNGGVVYGATFDEKFNVIHKKIDKIDEIHKLRTSKYVQSPIGETYKEAKSELEKGKLVLYTGTPCQIEGLLKFLNKKYSNLYTQDIICHGVPSPKVYNKYLQECKKKNGENSISNVNFRDKETGWKTYSFSIKFEKNKYQTNKFNIDPYMKSFLQNLSLRDSCYKCYFKSKYRKSDITLADFWGVENVLPEFFDNKGTSLVIINSKKGNHIFEEIKNYTEYKQIDLDDAIKYNCAMIHSVKPSKNREKFFYDLDKYEFAKLVKKYENKDNFIKKVLRKIKRTILRNK